MNYFNFLNLIFITLFLIVTLPANAKDNSSSATSKKIETHQGHSDHQHGEGEHDHSQQEASVQKTKSQNLLVKVKGMVCAFCAQGIRKNFNSRPEVQDTQVDLDKMEVLITLKKGQSLSEETIKSLVTDAGFKFSGVTGE